MNMAENDLNIRKGTPLRFSPIERRLLLRLVQKRAAVFACKRLDAISAGKRQEAWNDLCNEYNSHPGVSKRTIQQVRKWWTNEKTRRKKLAANINEHVSSDGRSKSCYQTAMKSETELRKELDEIEQFVEESMPPDMLPLTVEMGELASDDDDDEYTELEGHILVEEGVEQAYSEGGACSESSLPNSPKARRSTYRLSAAATNCEYSRDGVAEEEMEGSVEELQGVTGQDDELLSLRVKEQRYRTDIARLELENLIKKFKHDEVLGSLALQEARLRVILLKRRLCEIPPK